MTAKIIPFDYQGRAVRFDVDGWLHATEIAERFGKEPHEWLRLPDTASYLAAISKTGKFPELVRTKRGRYGGTWLHPKLAVVFARWHSVDFAVWCDEQIDTLLRGSQGNWQLRIDQNPAWTIATGETPVDYVPEGQLKAMHAYGGDAKQQQMLESTYKAALQASAQAMSPFTAATGEKAEKILAQMKAGKVLIYRTLGMNQAASTTGEYALGQSLSKALAECGIK